MNGNKLKNLIKRVPTEPGIYIFSDSNKEKLYIGKATNLKSRVGSYLKTEDQRIRKMVELARSLKFTPTQSDIEALILESQLIKRFQPPFNIVMRDDKQYFYVGFTKDTFPKLFLTHQPTKLWITPFNGVIHSLVGPFTDGNALKTTLRYLRRIFPYCTCKKPHNNFCLNYHIGKCLGFCCLKKPELSIKYQVSRGYKKNIRAIKEILSGKKGSLIKKLEREMVQMAKNANLEKAIELKDKISKLKRVFENAKIIGNWKFFRNSKLETTERSRAVAYMAIRNLEAKNKKQNVLYGIKQLLKLARLPVCIEGYDVSNIQGVHATGSMVTFIHGQPDKNFYRKFKIQTKQTPDDTAMLKEILERRFKHYEWPFPDLILIDGGKSQVNTAVKTLKNMAIKIPIIGISKNERHIGHQLIITGRKTPLSLTKLSGTDKNLLLTIDSEAHRFAIGYYRKLHRKLFK